jgi:DNA repair exonuclease SbcCD ATPase subunit
MKLVLNNFRCFKELTLELPENGTILLWGTSGIGKTTIFKAINFVLYGKEQKVVKHGEKKCKVEFHFNDIVVIRTKVPNHLTLKKSNGDEYADEPAQKEIEKIFGRDFLLTSYMAQKGTESFFNLSNNEKSSFLQKLSLKDFDVESIRRKTRDIIKERKDKLLVNSTKHKMVKNEYDSITLIKEPKLKIDLKGKSLDECIDSDNKLKDKVKKILKEKRIELETTGNNLEKISVNSVRIEEKEKILTDLTLKLKDYIEEEDIESLKEDLKIYNKCILYYTLKKSCKDVKNEYDKMLEDERKKLKEDIEKTKMSISQIEVLSENDLSVINKLKTIYDKTKIKSLIDFESKLENINILKKEEMINTLTLSLNENRDKLSKKQVQHESLKKNIKELQDTVGNKGHSKYKCPKCSISIYVEGECLKEITENIDEIKITLKEFLGKKDIEEKEIKKLEMEIKTINNDLVSMKVEHSNDIKKRDELQGYISIIKECGKKYLDLSVLKGMIDKDTENRYKIKTYQENLDKCLKTIELTVDILPHYLKKKRDEIISLKKKYEEVKADLEDIEIDSRDFYTSGVEELKRKIENYEERVKNRDKITKEKQKVEYEIKDLKKGLEGIDNIDVLRGKILEIKEDIVKKEETEEKLKLREGKLLKYKEDVEKYKNQVDVTTRLEEIKTEEERLIRALGISELMFKKINDAEGYSLQNTLDTINTDLEEFISHFFGDTFTVRLDSFKESKDGDKKSSIEVIIMQEGEQIPIDTLSGGEFDRLALALFLSFNKTSKSNIILLDECLASLHSELVEDIVELIKTKLSDKLVLFTLHQANTGIFDTIIDIEKYRCC